MYTAFRLDAEELMGIKQSAEIIDLQERKERLIRKPFVPETGNPESGNYLDWLRHLQEKGDTLKILNFMGENI